MAQYILWVIKTTEIEAVLIRELAEDKQICPLCGSRKIIKCGKRYSKHNIAQRYLCKICGTSFCESVHGYFKSKHPLYVKQFAIELYLNGMSLRKIQDKLQEDLGVEVSHVSILKWLNNVGIERRQTSGDQKNKIIRNLIEIGVSTIIRFSTSESPEKMIILTNSLPLQNPSEIRHAVAESTNIEDTK